LGHKCTKCGQTYPDAAPELLAGCSNCGARFFFYIREEALKKNPEPFKEALIELDKVNKIQIEKDIREMTGLDEKPEKPVVLDLESVRIIEPGKFEIDLANLFSKQRILIYKLEEGKYIIDLESSMKTDKKKIDKKIRDPTLVKGDKENSSKIDEEDYSESEEVLQ
jgi:predicted  nucleic acid-binding Zn-ribbon protein